MKRHIFHQHTKSVLVNCVKTLTHFVMVCCVLATSLLGFVKAATVQHLVTQTATATGAGATGIPSIASFTIPSGKNRVLFIWTTFERDHCSPADGSGGLCASGNAAGTGLGDNWPEPRTGTPPATTSNNQIIARVTGSGGTIDRQNALVIGGTPSGDTRFINISNSPSGSPAGTAFFSLSSFHIVLFENDINTLLSGAASGTVSITLPNVTTPANAGDDALLSASVFQNVEQTVTGFVRNATATAQVTTGTAGNFNLAPAAYDAGQAPDEADDGKLVMGTNSSVAGFLTPAGYVALSTLSTTNASGTYDTPNGNINNEPNGVSSGGYFRNGGATPGSLYTLTSAGTATPLVYGGTNASFLLESDNADVSDAPVSYGNTSHTLSGIRLGGSVDADASLLNSATANGDDTNNTNDEDGVTLVSLLPTGETTIVPISVQGAGGFLNAWFDWNADGDFSDAGEQMATNQAVAVGTTNLSVAVPATAIVGPTFARFRVCTNNTATDNCSTPTNTVQSGEVEDYQFSVSRKLVLRKTTLGAVGGPFGFTLTNTAQTTGTVTTTATATPTQVDGDTGTAGTQVFSISSPTAAVTINENSLPSGSWSLTGATCVNASSTTVGSLSGNTYTLTGAEIAASTSFTCTFTNTLVLTLSGTVWNDVDSSVTINGSEAGTNAGSYALTVYAVSGSGNVIAKALVATNGTYSFSNIPANTSFTLRLSNDSSVSIGSPASAASLPGGWTNTGENKNGVSETTTPGEIALTTGTANVSNYNFGITLPTPPSICAAAGGLRGANIFASSGNFGSTAGPAGTEAGALPAGRTTYTYATLTSSSPNDGSYTVVNQPDVSVFGAWATPVDHTTGNLTGNMMIVNASFGPGVFYQETLTVTANSNYEFSFWIMNLITNGAPILPNVVLELNRIGVDDNNDGTVDEAGEAQTVISTGDIPLNNPIWRNFGSVVNTGASTQLEVRFRNNAPGGAGNDLAIDDLVFSTCTLPSGTLSGTLYQDVNTNGTFQSGTDTRLPANIAVELVDTKGTVSTSDDVLVSTVQTDASGDYSFANIPVGSNYTVQVASGDPQIPTGFVATSPATAIYTNVPITVGATTTRDFGYQQFADLGISKTGPASIVEGNTFSYTVRAWNNGPGVANGTTITDTVPSNLSGVTWTCAATGTASCGTSSGSGNAISLTADLPVDTGAASSPDTNYVTLTVTGLANLRGSITNTANIAVPSGFSDPGPTTNSSSVATTISLAPTQNSPLFTNNSSCLPMTGLNIAAGSSGSYSNTITNAQGIQISYTVDQVIETRGFARSLVAYTPGTWSGDSWDNYFGAGNMTNAGLSSDVGNARLQYRLRVYGTLNGNPVPLNLLMGSAEDDGLGATTSTGYEYTQGITNGSDWQLIDKLINVNASGAGFKNIFFSTNPKFIRMMTGGSVAIAVTSYPATSSDPLTINALFEGSGKSAQAYCTLFFQDYGNAPASYGEAKHMLIQTTSGGSPSPAPTGTDTAPTQYNLLNLSLGTPGYDTSTWLGSSKPSQETATNPSDSKDGLPSTTLTASGGDSSLSLSCSNTSASATTIAAWIDFNNNGTFESGERTTASCPIGGGTVTLTWVGQLPTIATPWARFRVSSQASDLTNPTGTAFNGEVEDYQLSFVMNINLAVTKVSSLSGPQVGDTVTYTVTVQNLSTTNATGVVVTDFFSTDLTFVETIGCAEDPNFLTGPSVTCSLGSINASNTKSFTVKGIVIDQGAPGDDDDVGRVITNSISVTANETDSDASNNSSSVVITVSKLQLYKEVRNVTAGGSFTTSVTGKPGDVLEYRINYTRTGPPIFDVLLEDTLDANTTLEQDSYGLSDDKEITLHCPDGSDVFLETGVIATISIDLVAQCSLNTASDVTATVREALLSGETGYFLFRARIQ